MTTRRRRLLWLSVGGAVLAVAGIAAWLQFGQRPKPKVVGLEWGAPVNGLRAAVDFIPEDRVFEFDQFVQVRLRIQNVSRKPIQIQTPQTPRRDRMVFLDDVLNGHSLDMYFGRPTSGPMKLERIQPGETIALDHARLFFADAPAFLALLEQKPQLSAVVVMASPGVHVVLMALYFQAPSPPPAPGNAVTWAGKLQTGPKAICIVPQRDRGERQNDLNLLLTQAGIETDFSAHQAYSWSNPSNARRLPYWSPGDPQMVSLESDFRAGLYEELRVVRLPPQRRHGIEMFLRDLGSPFYTRWKRYEFRVLSVPTTGSVIVPPGKEIMVNPGRAGPLARPSIWRRLFGRLGLSKMTTEPEWVPVDVSWLENVDPGAIDALDCRGAHLGNADLRNLSGLKQLRELDLRGNPISDRGLDHLLGLKQLRSLTLPNTITAKGLSRLRNLPALEQLAVGGRDGITDAALVEIARIGSLKRLLLTYTGITDAGLAHVRKMQGLECLMLTGTPIGDGGIEKLRGHPSLTVLSLADTQVSDAGLAHLKTLPALVLLKLNGTQVTDEGLKHLRPMKSLEWLDLSRTQITDAGLVHLAELSGLKKLDLTDTKITDAGLANLTRLTSLQELHLVRTPITEKGIPHLASISSLRKVLLGETKVTKYGYYTLKEELPNCEISWH